MATQRIRRVFTLFVALWAVAMVTMHLDRRLSAARRVAVDVPALMAAESARRAGGVSWMPGFRDATRGVCLCEDCAGSFDEAYYVDTAHTAAPARSAAEAGALARLLHLVIADTPEGDVVDVGGAAYDLTQLELTVLRDMDRCGRRIWAVPARNASETPMLRARDAYRLNVRVGSCAQTCASVPARPVSLLRISGSEFEEVASALVAFYQRVVPGGVVLVGDYHAGSGAKAAVDTFRSASLVSDPLHVVLESQHPYIGAAWWAVTAK